MARIGIPVLLLMLTVLPGWASGAPVSIEIVPQTPSETDSVLVKTLLEWNTGGYNVVSSWVTFPSAFNPQIDIDVSSPAPGEMVPAVLTSDIHTTDLGLLPAGVYSYTVREFNWQRSSDVVFDVGSLSGSFTVVPEPATLGFALFGLAGLAMRRRRS